MTAKYGDVNKCRRKEKCKMATLIRQVWWKRREKTNNNKQTLSEKKEEAGNVSEQRDKGWIHVIRVHDTTGT